MKIKKISVSPNDTILSAIQKIDESGIQIVLVLDDNGILAGTVTDGDVRRAILKGISADEPVRLIMNKQPVVGKVNESRENILNRMKNRRLHQIPIVDNNKRVISIEIMDEIIQLSQRDNWVVLMAGGKGTRLRPLTNDCPKPLLKVGSKPILETILDNFVENGFKNYYLAINYKGEMIEEYFGDGSQWGVNIRYIREDKKLGTAGALSLIKEINDLPLIVMNGDLLTRVNFNQLLSFHTENQANATMCVREYSIQVPYGVVNIDRHYLKGIDEKPVHRFMINAGVYVLDPEVLRLIPQDSFFNMTNLFDKVIKNGNRAVTFPIREYWLDIGQISDYEKANGEYQGCFKD